MVDEEPLRVTSAYTYPSLTVGLMVNPFPKKKKKKGKKGKKRR